MDYDFSNLTKAQVEALLECFDFLNNGFEELSSFEIDNVWMVNLKHKRTNKRLRVIIRPLNYKITCGGDIRKQVFFGSSKDRYKLVVNSPRDIGVIRLNPGGDQKLVSN